MEKTKEQMIADLYALRGGLSLISSRTDEIKREEKVITAKNEANEKGRLAERHLAKEVDLLKEKRNSLKKCETKQKEKVKTLKERNGSEIAELESVINSRIKLRKRASWSEIDDKIKVANKFWIILFSVMGISLIWSIIDIDSFLKVVTYMFSEEDIGGLGSIAVILFYAVSVIVIGTIIAELCVQCSTVPKERKRLEETRFQLKKEIVEAESNLKDYKTEMDSLSYKMRVAEEKQEREGGNFNRLLQENANYIQKCRQKIAEAAEKSKIVKAALNETYDVWLAESDWKNVDLLIYYLETNRADDLKEALQLVDKQRQTESIAKAIATAARAIQDTVHTATMRLAGAMEASFSLLSDKLSAINAKMGRLSTLVEQSTDMGEQMAKMQGEQLTLQKELLNAEKLNGALLEKANRSSEELLNDLRYGQRYWVK